MTYIYFTFCFANFMCILFSLYNILEFYMYIQIQMYPESNKFLNILLDLIIYLSMCVLLVGSPYCFINNSNETSNWLYVTHQTSISILNKTKN